MDDGLAGLLASIGLLVASVAELLVSGYSCLTLTPKLCGCLRASSANGEAASDGHLKTDNMVHQWVIAQKHVPTKKSQQSPIYVVQPIPMPMHPMMQVNAFSFSHSRLQPAIPYRQCKGNRSTRACVHV